MNKKVISMIVILFLVIGGYFFLFGNKGDQIIPTVIGTPSVVEEQPTYEPAMGQPSYEPIPVCDPNEDKSCLKGA